MMLLPLVVVLESLTIILEAVNQIIMMMTGNIIIEIIMIKQIDGKTKLYIK